MSWTDRVKPDARLQQRLAEWEHAPPRVTGLPSWTDRVKPDARLQQCVAEWGRAESTPAAPFHWTWERLAGWVAFFALVALLLFTNPVLLSALLGIACFCGVLYALEVAYRLWTRPGSAARTGWRPGTLRLEPRNRTTRLVD